MRSWKDRIQQTIRDAGYKTIRHFAKQHGISADGIYRLRRKPLLEAAEILGDKELKAAIEKNMSVKAYKASLRRRVGHIKGNSNAAALERMCLADNTAALGFYEELRQRNRVTKPVLAVAKRYGLA